MTDNERPDPDALLSRISDEADKEKRGRLKIFFGFSAGVGKTYAMLKAALERNKEGFDVLVGVVETHGRPETESLLEGLKILQPREVSYRGLLLKEFDLDAALTRKPDIVLVDELAHANAPGTRHPKRWNDVIELLDAGIDVYTTLNVQHIESLNDVVASATGVWVKETIPDTVFDMAEDVVLVDIDEDDLIQRLRDGKVYVAPGATARATENFFKKSNLQALREIALRRTADRVDAQRETDADGNKGPVLAEKILVCLDANDMAAQTLRTARRFAAALKAPWEAAHVQTSGKTDPEKARYLGALERMVERLGGTMTFLRGINVVDEILAYAREKRFTKIVVGKGAGNILGNFLADLFIDRLIRQSDTIDIYVVMGETTRSFVESRKESFLSRIRPFNYLLSIVFAVIFSIPIYMLPSVLSPLENVLFYLIGTAIAAERLGFGPALFYVLMTAVPFYRPFDLPFLPTTAFAVPNPFLSFFFMMTVSLIVALQASRLHAQAQASRTREKQAQDMLSLTRRLASAGGRTAVARLVAEKIQESIGGTSTIWMIDEEGHPAILLGELPQETYHKEFGSLEWCFENGQPSGHGTSTLPSASGLYLPLTTTAGTIGVLGYYRDETETTQGRENIVLLETIAGILATTLDRVRAEELTGAPLSLSDVQKSE